MNTKNIIAENERRYAQLFCEYNPITGVGSQIERFPFKLYNDKPELYLPMSMMDKYGGYDCFQDQTGKYFQDAFLEFLRDRIRSDFEFWAYFCIKIKPKGESGGLIKYSLNWPQRYTLAKLMDLFLSGVPIRVCLVKARQWGGSTLVQMFMMWIQTVHQTYWNSAIVAEVEAQALGIRSMYKTAIDNYRPGIQNLTFETYEGNSDWKWIPERNCVISIGSMQKPNKIRSQDISMAHCSEVGLWTKSENKSPEDLVQTLQGTILNKPMSMFVLESTAKGQGNFFHTTYLKAESGENNYTPWFVAWWQIELYTIEFESLEEKMSFIESLSEYEQFVWGLGATLEGIKWYRWQLREFNGDKWRMGNEFPSTPDEAFAFSGRPVFNPSYVQAMKKDLKDPKFVGDIFPQGIMGKEAFKDIKIEETPGGPFKIWAMPNFPPAPEGKIIKNRYAMFVDIGGTSKDADYSAVSVIDRYMMSLGGLPEAVASWHGHLDQDLFAWNAAQIGFFYEMAYLGFEVNSLRQLEDNDTEGDHSYIILDKIAEHYNNLYMRTTPEQIKQGVAVRYGFHTNHQTKGMIVDNYRGLLRDRGYIEYDKRAYDEARWYIIKPNGKMGNVDGQHDDLLITRMGALWLATSNDSRMGKLEIVDKNAGRKILLKKKLVKSAAIT